MKVVTIVGPLNVCPHLPIRLRPVTKGIPANKYAPAVLHPLKIHTTQTLWCSAACPVGEKALFAIGTSHGLHTLEGLTSMWTVSQKSFSRKRSSDARGFRRHGNASHDSVQAVEWLSSDVIASGLRNSNLYLYDIRNGGSALRLQHSQSVTKIRRVDPWRIVVGGYNTVGNPVFLTNSINDRHSFAHVFTGGNV